MIQAHDHQDDRAGIPADDQTSTVIPLFVLPEAPV